MDYEEAKNQIEVYINEVLDPFDNLIRKKEINLTINNLIEESQSDIVIDWSNFRLILFHII